MTVLAYTLNAKGGIGVKNDPKFIGERIKSLRENSGLTQSNLANYLQVDQSLVSMIEKGKRTLTAEMLDKLAALFGLEVSTLLDLEAPVKPLSFALRASEIKEGDLEAISAINRIALNSKFMTKLLAGEHTDG